MSLLWPETIYVGLFPGHCWLQHGRSGTVQPFPQSQSQPFDGTALLRALETMLDVQDNKLCKGARLNVTVSDSMALIAALPWQDALRRREELYVYAQAFFKKMGMVIDNDWILQPEFHQYRAMGLAYALPRAWLIELAKLVGESGLKLKTVLPVSAAAYCRQKQHRQEGQTLLLLQEVHRHSAMIYGRDGLLGYDVEPLTLSAKASGLRLLKRVCAAYDNITGVTHWSPFPSELEPVPAPDFIPDCIPNAKWHSLACGAWNQ